MADNPGDINIYSVGLIYISVCSSLSPEETVRLVNLEYPTGISSWWSIDEAGVFQGGKPNPCPCEQNPDTHKHYLLSC